MATINPISAALRLTLDLGTEGEKQITKTVSLGSINEKTDADSLAALADVIETLVEYPVAYVKKFSAGLLVR